MTTKVSFGAGKGKKAKAADAATNDLLGGASTPSMSDLLGGGTIPTNGGNGSANDLLGNSPSVTLPSTGIKPVTEADILREAGIPSVGSPPNGALPGVGDHGIALLVKEFQEFKHQTFGAIRGVQDVVSSLQKALEQSTASMGDSVKILATVLGEVKQKLDSFSTDNTGEGEDETAPFDPALDKTLKEVFAAMDGQVPKGGQQAWNALAIAGNIAAQRHPNYTAEDVVAAMITVGFPIHEGQIVITK